MGTGPVLLLLGGGWNSQYNWVYGWMTESNLNNGMNYIRVTKESYKILLLSSDRVLGEALEPGPSPIIHVR